MTRINALNAVLFALVVVAGCGGGGGTTHLDAKAGTGGKDGGSGGAGGKDSGAGGAGGVDALPGDVSLDTVASDTGPGDASPDTADAAPADAAQDAASPDSTPPDAEVDVASLELDTAAPDAPAPDAASPDTGEPDATLAQDTAAPDAPVVGACTTPTTTQLKSHRVLGPVFSANASVTYKIPKGYRLNGSLTLPTMPAGGNLGAGSFVVALSADQSQAYVYHPLAPLGNTFTYEIPLPEGSYTMVYMFQVQFGNVGSGPTLTRLFTDQVVVCGDQQHDVTLTDFGAVQSAMVTVNGLLAFDPPVATSRSVSLTMENTTHTVRVSPAPVLTSSDSAAFTVTMPVADLVPYVTVADGGSFVPPKVGGYQATVKLPEEPYATSYSLAIPALGKISGTISDPGAQVYTGGFNHSINCDPADTGLTASSIFETSKGAFFTDTFTYRTYERIGHRCKLYNYYFVQMVTSATAYENGFGIVMTPYPAPSMVISGNVAQDFTVPDTGMKIAVDVTVQDESGAPLANTYVTASSTALSAASLANAEFHTNTAATDGTGKTTLNILPGTYRWVELTRP